MSKDRSDFNRKVKAAFRAFPPPSWSSDYDPFLLSYFERMMKMDIKWRVEFKEHVKRLSTFMNLHRLGGSGLPVSITLRSFFAEYANRLMKHGPQSFPTSFNVLVDFLDFDDDFRIFRILPERDHALALSDYLEWYTSAEWLPAKTSLLIDTIKEGIVYTYSFLDEVQNFTVSTPESKLIVVGLALVRHRSSLSILLLAGESPPRPSDEFIKENLEQLRTASFKDGIFSDPDLGIKDRYLETHPKYARVILLGRIGLENSSFGVRYINKDTGPNYMISTNDSTIVQDDRDPLEREKIMQGALDKLSEYDNLFSFLSSLVFLPVFFADKPELVSEHVFSTDNHALRNSLDFKRACKYARADDLVFQRSVFIRVADFNAEPTEPVQHLVHPPELKFESSGYWKPLLAGEIGEDEEGNPIIGRTWVERTDHWVVNSPSKFVARPVVKLPEGPDPGWVYIMRVESQALGVFKIGLTRRDTDKRARELSSATGVALPFGVLAHWYVGDCVSVEREAHSRLKHCRVSKKREFFRAPLGYLHATVKAVIDDICGHQVA